VSRPQQLASVEGAVDGRPGHRERFGEVVDQDVTASGEFDGGHLDGERGAGLVSDVDYLEWLPALALERGTGGVDRIALAA
jgi:hypothetical protein